MIPDSWIRRAADDLQPWLQVAFPETRQQWHKVVRDWRIDSSTDEACELSSQCSQHPCLAHYCPAAWVYEGRWAHNSFIHDKRISPAEARCVARMLVGGQGLRGGDP
eukprot:2930340-Karenia_brevis.AAC.1